MIHQTERLILRPWEEKDAEDLYQYAKDPDIGPIAGWPVHTSIEESRGIIKNVLSEEGTYAVVLKETNRPVGSIGLMKGRQSNLPISNDEGEIGYWIGKPYWGRGLIPEAVCELLRYGFEELQLKKIWCGYFEGNEKSKRVQEKCGFVYDHTNKNIIWRLMGDIRTEHLSILTYEHWVELKKQKKTLSLFQNVDCVSFYVDNLDRGIVFYRDLLGLKLLWRAENYCGLGMAEGITEVVLVNQHNPVANFKVESVEKALSAFIQAGGSVEYGPFDIDIGKCVVVTDPWDNKYCLLDMTKGKYATDEKGNVIGVKDYHIMGGRK